MPFRFLRAPTLRHVILWLLASLIVVFLAGLLLLSRLNLSYSQDALSELRREQIREVVSAGLARIDARQKALVSYTVTLANIGESFYRLSANRAASDTASLRTDIEKALQAHLADLQGVSAAGLWFEPGVLGEGGRSYMPYYTVAPDNREPVRQNTEALYVDYHEAPWYAHTLGDGPELNDARTGQVYWSPVYFDLSTERAVLALASPMFDQNGRLLGMATTEWNASSIIDLVSQVTVTPNSFAFLNDQNNRNLSSLSQGEDSRQEQALIDAILARHLGDSLADRSGNGPSSLADQSLDVAGIRYELYYAGTAGGMVYGAGVPEAEVMAVLRPMEQINRQILLATVAALLLISGFLVYRIVVLIRELQASYTDELTGLPNRARLLRDLKARQGAALLLLNLDRFNQINSLFGTLCGDHVLIAIATRFSELKRYRSVRSIYRLPGDEFAVLMEFSSEQEVQTMADAMRDLVSEQRVQWKNQPLALDASVGMAIRETPQAGAPADQLVSQAKTAVLLAREQGQYKRLHDPDSGIEESYEHNLFWANRLKEAISQNCLVPWFQPIHDNQRGGITKYECLVRISEPNGDIVSAGRFVDIAYKLRLNRAITALMVEQCFQIFRERDEEFSINLSYGDIADPTTVDRILTVLKASGMGHRVIFEILESDGIENYDEIHSFIDQVRPYGCRIAIDDFGTGYSNFSHILSMEVDFIKIDGSLIRHIHEDETALLVTRGIVQFARSLNIRTVAEFVHNEQVQARVEELGIDFSQGEFFGMARPEL